MAAKRGSDHLISTPVSSKAKNSRLDALQRLQQNITALAEQNPDNPLIKEILTDFNDLGVVLRNLVDMESPEEKERKRSVVIIGLPEPEAIGSVQRAKADVQTVETMLDALNIQAVPSQVYRMGKPTDDKKRPRLVKVVLPSSKIQHMTLGALKRRRQELQNVDGFQRAIIRPSLSPEELVKDRELRARLKQMKAENPNVRVFIKNGEIQVDGQVQIKNF
jgi:hypothetical protein